MAVQVNLRVNEGMRDKLVAAAEARDVSMNKEINDRLGRTFDAPRLFDTKKPTFGVLRILEEAMNAAGESALFERTHSWEIARTKSWLSDPTAYHAAMEAAIAVLRECAPAGKKIAPETPTPWDGRFWAEFFLKQAASGKPNVPENIALAQDLRASIGDELAKRIGARVNSDPHEAARNRVAKREKP
jgi:Arc-like DNA binding dprotein